MNVGIYIYKDAEVLDFSGPYEVFSTANRFLAHEEQFNVFLVAEDTKPVNARGDYSVNPKYGFNDHPQIDIFIVVGGVHTEELKKINVIDWVFETSKKSTIVASVCTGAFILAEAGLLDHRKVTTHWDDIKDLRESYPKLDVIGSQRWVDEGSIITSGGISAGIDMSLYLVSKLENQELAEKTAKQMEYEWHKKS